MKINELWIIQSSSKTKKGFSEFMHTFQVGVKIKEIGTAYV